MFYISYKIYRPLNFASPHDVSPPLPLFPRNDMGKGVLHNQIELTIKKPKWRCFSEERKKQHKKLRLSYCLHMQHRSMVNRLFKSILLHYLWCDKCTNTTCHAHLPYYNEIFIDWCIPVLSNNPAVLSCHSNLSHIVYTSNKMILDWLGV